MHRRDLLRGAAAGAALALVPSEARAAWERVAAGVRPHRALTPEQLAVVATLSDVIIPRTDTPGALDVRVPAFIESLVGGSWMENARTEFQTGLENLRQHLGPATGASLTTLIDELERRPDRRTEPARTYWQLKSLIVHGYFTSETVMREVLRTEVMPGRFDGAAPVTLRRSTAAPRRGAHG